MADTTSTNRGSAFTDDILYKLTNNAMTKFQDYIKGLPDRADFENLERAKGVANTINIMSSEKGYYVIATDPQLCDMQTFCDDKRYNTQLEAMVGYMTQLEPNRTEWLEIASYNKRMAKDRGEIERQANKLIKQLCTLN